MDESWFVTCFTQGVDEDLRKFLKAGRPKSLEACVATSQRLAGHEGITVRSTSRVLTTTASADMGGTTAHDNPTTTATGATAPAPGTAIGTMVAEVMGAVLRVLGTDGPSRRRVSGRSSQNCYECGVDGHLTRDCPTLTPEERARKQAEAAAKRAKREANRQS